MEGRFISKDPVGFKNGINTYSYVQNNPINWIDPSGLWSITGGGYLFGGGEVAFGVDNGRFFLTGRAGLGLGGGISYDPNGGIPGPAPQNPSKGGIVLSDSGQAMFAAGPIFANGEIGVGRNYSNPQTSGYTSLSGGIAGAFRGIKASGSVGAQCTIYNRAR